MTSKQQLLDIDIERYLLGELPSDRAAALEKVFDADPEAREKLRVLEAENAAILDAYPPHLMAVQIREKAEKAEVGTGARRRVWVPVLSATVAAAAAVLAVLVLPTGTDNQGEYIGTKGDKNPKLYVYRQGEESPLTADDKASEGDMIQLRYAPNGKTHGVIFSVDGRGTVTLHFPSNENGSTKINPKGTHSLEFSYELDDAPNFERFFFVTSDSALNVADLLDKGKAWGTPTTDKITYSNGVYITDFRLKKK